MKPTHSRRAAYFITGVAAVLVFGGACLLKYGASVFFSFDGAGYMATANAMLRHPVGFYYTANFLQSFGNLYWPINFSWLPEFRFAFYGGLIRPVPAYLIIGLLVYLTSFAFVLAFDFGPRVALAGALGIELLTMPLRYPPLLHGYFYSWDGPNWMPMVYAFLGLLAAFGWTGRGPLYRSSLAMACFVAASLWTVGALTKLCFVIAVGAAPFGFALFIAADNWRERVWKVAAILLTALVFALGPMDFLRGMLAYSTNDLLLPNVRLATAGDIGGLLGALIYTKFWTQLELVRMISGLNIVVGGLLSALVLIAAPGMRRRGRAFGWSSLAGLAAVMFFFYGIVLVGCIAVALVLAVVAAVGHLLPMVAKKLTDRGWRTGTILDPPEPLRAAIAVSLFGAILVAMAWRSSPPSTMPYPPGDPPLMRDLAQSIRFEPNDKFRGRLLSVAARKSAPIPSQDTVVYRAINSVLTLTARTGNDFSYSGPAYFGVPTAEEQNRLATPAELAFMSMVLTKRGALQVPDHRLISRLNPRMLAAVGVSRILMDRSARPPASFALDADDVADNLRLYRLADANLGNYSPVEVLVEKDADSALEALAAADFDPERSILVENRIKAELVPATGASVTRTSDGLRVAAKSAGQSILLLPFEYTRCMRLAIATGDQHASLFRADVMLTGLFFSGSVDADISIRFGPFTRPRCRLDDVRETEAWGLAYKPFLALRERHPDLFDFARYN